MICTECGLEVFLVKIQYMLKCLKYIETYGTPTPTMIFSFSPHTHMQKIWSWRSGTKSYRLNTRLGMWKGNAGAVSIDARLVWEEGTNVAPVCEAWMTEHINNLVSIPFLEAYLLSEDGHSSVPATLGWRCRHWIRDLRLKGFLLQTILKSCCSETVRPSEVGSKRKILGALLRHRSSSVVWDKEMELWPSRFVQLTLQQALTWTQGDHN